MLGHRLYDEVAGINRTNTTCPDTIIPTVGNYGEICTVTTDMRLAESSDPGPGSSRKRTARTHRSSLVWGKKLLDAIRKLN